MSLEIHEDMWSSCSSIMEALSDSLAESMDYAAIVRYCRENDSTQLLGVITLEFIDIHISQLADELAENELT